MIHCPYCGYKAVDMSTHNDADSRSRYVCTGPETHVFRDGERPPDEEPLIILAR